jgi:hypothetical protein
MNPFYRSAIVAGTLGALVVKAYDDGKTNTPPANVVEYRRRWVSKARLYAAAEVKGVAQS